MEYDSNSTFVKQGREKGREHKKARNGNGNGKQDRNREEEEEETHISNELVVRRKNSADDSSVTGCTRHATGDLGAGGRAVVQCITVQWGGRCCAVTGCVQCSGCGRAVQWLGLCSAVAGCVGEAVTARAARGEAGLATAWGRREDKICAVIT